MDEYKVTTTKLRNVFKPRWWQLRRRYHIWQTRRTRERMLAEMDPVVRAAYEDAQRRIERKVLFGDE